METASLARPAAPICFAPTPAKEPETMNAIITARGNARNPVRLQAFTLGDLLRRKGPDYAARCIERRYDIRRRHADLVAAMLGCG